MPEPSGNGLPMDRDALVMEYLPLVKRVAYRIVARVPGRVDVQDLISAGCVGLLTAIDRFDPSRGKPFEVFAEWRIKGAILDELRGHDHLTRGQRHLANKVLAARRRLEQEQGGEVSVEAIAQEVGVDPGVVEDLIGRTDAPGFVSLSDLGVEREGLDEVMRIQRSVAPDPYQSVYIKDLKERLVGALEELPKNEKLVLSLYYNEKLTYKEIAAVLDRTESRVCQIHKQAVEHLRVALGEVPEGAKRKSRRRRGRPRKKASQP